MVMKRQMIIIIISAKIWKNCVEPTNTISEAMSQWIAMWQQMAMKLLKNYVKHLGLQGVWRKKMKKMKMNKRWCRASPRLTTLYKKLKAFFYAQSGSDADRENIFESQKVVFSIQTKNRQEAKGTV
jgi:hypothetical protein